MNTNILVMKILYDFNKLNQTKKLKHSAKSKFFLYYIVTSLSNMNNHAASFS